MQYIQYNLYQHVDSLKIKDLEVNTLNQQATLMKH